MIADFESLVAMARSERRAWLFGEEGDFGSNGQMQFLLIFSGASEPQCVPQPSEACAEGLREGGGKLRKWTQLAFQKRGAPRAHLAQNFRAIERTGARPADKS